MTTINHDMADDVADWAINNMADLRTAEIDTRSDRARREWDEIEPWHLPHMTRLVSACNGNCDQGDKCNCGPKEAASSCTEIGADGVPSVWESADGEVIPAFIGAFIALLAFCALIGMLQP